MIRVVNVRTLLPADRHKVVYVGRRCAGWPLHTLANPFKLKSEADRTNCLQQYHRWLLARPTLEKDLIDLWAETGGGRLPLGCWCAPAKCHADVLLEFLIERFGSFPGTDRPGWENKWNDGDVHVVPVGDSHAHELTRVCACDPNLTDENGRPCWHGDKMGVVVVHTAYDGRK